MSASNKKKLRKEQEASKVTEKQLTAQKEAKKTRLITTAFVVAMAVILVIAIVVGVNQTITSHGIREKNTIALTVGDHKISNAELNYFYLDAVNNFYSSYGSYATMFGLDPTLPLNEQVVDEATGRTWADDFLDTAKNNATSAYAMADAAEAAGYSLSEEDQRNLEYALINLDGYAALYGYADGDAYLKALYGAGATRESYQKYNELSAIASGYYNYYSNSLTYEDADLRAKEAENFGAYSSYDYNTYYLSANRFLEGGTTDSEGKTTYTDEETAASVAAAEEAAKALTGDDIDSVEALDAAIAALSINADTEASSTANEGTLYTSLTGNYADWIADSSRKEGDKAYFASTSTTTAEDGTETTTTNGYYVVYFVGTNDNTFPLKNVRHILVTPTHDPEEGEAAHADGETYSAEELAAAKATAEEILNEWKSGDATEDSFAALANEKSADGDGTTGGLYEDIYPGQMVSSFNDWCYDESRVSGDTGIVESNYGYHIMYFVGNSEQTYRDSLIESELRSADMGEWYTSRIESISVTEGNTNYIRKNLVLSAD